MTLANVIMVTLAIVLALLIYDAQATETEVETQSMVAPLEWTFIPGLAAAGPDFITEGEPTWQ